MIQSIRVLTSSVYHSFKNCLQQLGRKGEAHLH